MREPANTDSKMLLTTQETANVLSVSKSAIDNSRCTGLLLGRKAPEWVKLTKKTVRYKLTTLNQWVEDLEESQAA